MRLCRSSPWMFFPLIVAAGCSSKPGTGPVWVGQLLPLEGANRTIGQHARQGVELAAADAQAAGHNVAGRPVAFLHVDSRGDAETVQAETVRLVTVNRAAALLADFDAALTERLLRANQSYGVPVIVPGELPAAADTDAVVALGVPPAVRGRLLARHAGGERRLPRVGVLTDSRRPVASALAAAFVKGWPGMRDAVEEWTFATDAEREERTTRLIQAAPAGILLACSVADFRALRPRLAAALPRAVLLYGGEDAGALPLQTEVEGSPEVDLATVYDTDHLSETGKAFARRYDERFHEPPDLYAAQAHDAARLLLDVMQHAGSSSKDALRKELTHLESFESATGPVQWKDRQPRRRVFLMTLKKGPAQVVQTIEPQDN